MLIASISEMDKRCLLASRILLEHLAMAEKKASIPGSRRRVVDDFHSVSDVTGWEEQL